MIRISVSLAMIACLSLLLTSTVDARMCFKGKPKPECDTFWITEIGLGFNFDQNRWENRGWPVSEIGYMWNVGRHHAVGITSYVSFETRHDDFRGGLKLRARRWISPKLSLDASGGALFLGGHTGEDFPAFTGHLGLNYMDLISPYVGLDILRNGSPLEGENWHFGLRFGSWPGSSLTAVAIGLVVFGLYSYTIAG